MTETSASATRGTALREPFHVMIVGGGLGGLCLAQGLTKSGIAVTVYERDAGAQIRDQGYRISLKETGAQVLHECLPQHLFNLCAATSIRQATRMVFMDEQLSQTFTKPVPPIQPGLGGFGINRLTLREILLADLGEQVRFGKTFHPYEQAEDGRVVAWFADGTSAKADLLVGADGTNSAVRAQLAPDAVVEELKWAIYGKTPITTDTLNWVPDVLVDSFNRVTGRGEAAFAVATCRTNEPATAAAARLAPGLTLTDMPAYLQWITPLLDERFRTADAVMLHRLATDMVRDWHPAVRRILAEADVTATFPVCVTSARPVKQSPRPAGMGGQPAPLVPDIARAALVLTHFEHGYITWIFAGITSVDSTAAASSAVFAIWSRRFSTGFASIVHPDSGVIGPDVHRREADRLIDPASPGVRPFRCRYPLQDQPSRGWRKILEVLASSLISVKQFLQIIGYG